MVRYEETIGRNKAHDECCFGINHWRWSETHQLCILEVLTDEESDSLEERGEAARGNEVQNLESSKGKQILRKGETRYCNRR